MGSDQGPLQGAGQGRAGGSGDHDGDHLVDVAGLMEQLLGVGPNASGPVRDVVAAVAGLCDEVLVGDLVNGAGLADSVVVLARLTHTLQAELGRRVTAATRTGVLRHTPRVTLVASGGMAGQAASQVLTAGVFADQHPALAASWRAGDITVEGVAAIARGLGPLPVQEQAQVLDLLLPVVDGLSVRQIRMVMARVLDLLTPQQRDVAEQARHDRRFLSFTTYGGMTIIRGELPDIDGAAVKAAIRALADSLRADGDGLTRGQRYADALITLVNAAAAHGDLPATGNGLPVAAAITISLTEAERLTTKTTTPTTHSPGSGDVEDSPVSGGGDDDDHGGGRLGFGVLAGAAHLPESDTTLGDAAARFALCGADLTGVLFTHPTNTNTNTPLHWPPRWPRPGWNPSPWAGRPAWRPEPNASRWRCATQAASSPAATDLPRNARPTTSPTGPTAAPPT